MILYRRSHKGRDLTLSVTFGYAICLVVFSFAIEMSGVFTEDLIGNQPVQVHTHPADSKSDTDYYTWAVTLLERRSRRISIIKILNMIIKINVNRR